MLSRLKANSLDSACRLSPQVTGLVETNACQHRAFILTEPRLFFSFNSSLLLFECMQHAVKCNRGSPLCCVEFRCRLILVIILTAVGMPSATRWLAPWENEMLVTAAQISSCVDTSWMADALLHVNGIFWSAALTPQGFIYSNGHWLTLRETNASASRLWWKVLFIFLSDF